MLLGSATRIKGTPIVSGLLGNNYWFNDPTELIPTEFDDSNLFRSNTADNTFLRNCYISYANTGSNSYILISDRSGKEFKSFLLPFQPQLLISANNILFLQTTENNIWRSLDTGKTFTNVASTIGTMASLAYRDNTYVSSILYVSTTEYGFYRSINGGVDWTHTAGGWSNGSRVAKVIVDNSQFIGIGNSGGIDGDARIVVSSDGDSWNSVSTPGNSYRLENIHFFNGYYYLQTRDIGNLSQSRLWKTDDLDLGWEELPHPFSTSEIRTFFILNNKLICYQQGSPVKVSISDDEGDSWAESNTNINSPVLNFSTRYIATKYRR